MPMSIQRHQPHCIWIVNKPVQMIHIFACHKSIRCEFRIFWYLCATNALDGLEIQQRHWHACMIRRTLWHAQIIHKSLALHEVNWKYFLLKIIATMSGKSAIISTFTCKHLIFPKKFSIKTIGITWLLWNRDLGYILQEMLIYYCFFLHYKNWNRCFATHVLLAVYWIIISMFQFSAEWGENNNTNEWKWASNSIRWLAIYILYLSAESIEIDLHEGNQHSASVCVPVCVCVICTLKSSAPNDMT